MNNLWEIDIDNPSGCLTNLNDDPYVMPYKEEGLLNLSFNMFERTGISSILFSAHLYRTDIDGTVIEDLGAINAFNNKSLIYGTTNPGRYDIFIPAPCGKGFNSNSYPYQSTVVTGAGGTTVTATIGSLGTKPYDVTWVVGEPAPHPIYQIGPWTYVINDKQYGTILGPGLTAVDTLLPPPLSQDIPCHRYKLVLDYSGAGADLFEFYTVPFQCVSCNDGEVVVVDSFYPQDTIDCEGQIKNYSNQFGNMPVLTTQLTHRVVLFGYLKKLASRLSLNYSSNCYHNSSSRIERRNLYGRAIPDWLEKDMASIIMGKTFYVDNEQYMIDGDRFTEEQDIELTDFQNINLTLRTCDCEVNFVC